MSNIKYSFDSNHDNNLGFQRYRSEVGPTLAYFHWLS